MLDSLVFISLQLIIIIQAHRNPFLEFLFLEYSFRRPLKFTLIDMNCYLKNVNAICGYGFANLIAVFSIKFFFLFFKFLICAHLNERSNRKKLF